MAVLKASTSSVNIDDGVYEATVLSIEVIQPKPESPFQDPYFKWTFHVYDTDDGQELTANAAMKLSERSKNRQWVEAILARKLAPGEEWDNETFPPKDCQVVVKNNEKGFAVIEDVLGVKRRGTPKRQAAAQTTDEGIPF